MACWSTTPWPPPQAVYFTDSYAPFLYAVPLGRFGRLPGQSAVRRIALTGDAAEQGAMNNGIEVTPQGRLLIVQMLAGRLISYDPDTGEQFRVDLGGASVLNGDGLLRLGRYLYVVRNVSNRIAKFRFNAAFTAAELVEEITDPWFDVPSTIAAFGPDLYAVNSRFTSTVPTPDTTYNIIRVRG